MFIDVFGAWEVSCLFYLFPVSKLFWGTRRRRQQLVIFPPGCSNSSSPIPALHGVGFQPAIKDESSLFVFLPLSRAYSLLHMGKLLFFGLRPTEVVDITAQIRDRPKLMVVVVGAKVVLSVVLCRPLQHFSPPASNE